ncbi:MAG: S41 family peptidase [Holosporales bacterium]|nr:S41 family peptidase [Holosporales bacterium]
MDVYSVTNSAAFEDLLFVVRKISKLHCVATKRVPINVTLRFNAEVGKLKSSQKRVKIWRAANRILQELKDANCKIFHKKASKKRVNREFEMYGFAVYVVHGGYRFNVTAVNDVAVSVLFDKARSILPYENLHGLRTTFAETLPYKKILNLYGIHTKSLFRYEYIKKGRRRKAVETFIVRPEEPTNVERSVFFDLYPEMSAAILTMKKCIYNDEYKQVLRNFFKAVRKLGIRYIAVDLIGNPGGSSLAVQEFLRYIPQHEGFQDYKVFVRKEDQLIPFTPKINVNKEKYKDLIFDGDVYVLTGETTRNAATRFAVLLQDNKLAKVIGESSGSKPSHYGHGTMFELPNTKLCLIVTSKEYKRPDVRKEKDTFQVPDHPIVWFQAREFFLQRICKNGPIPP